MNFQFGYTLLVQLIHQLKYNIFVKYVEQESRDCSQSRTYHNMSVRNGKVKMGNINKRKKQTKKQSLGRFCIYTRKELVFSLIIVFALVRILLHLN